MIFIDWPFQPVQIPSFSENVTVSVGGKVFEQHGIVIFGLLDDGEEGQQTQLGNKNPAGSRQMRFQSRGSR